MQFNPILQVLITYIVIDLALRSIALSESSKKVVKVRSVLFDGSDKNHASHKLVQNWADNVSDLHSKKTKPGSGIASKDLEGLMAEWPSEIDRMYPNLEVSFY